MSGKRQHFVPRFLQSGFASSTSGDEVYTWVYRKGAKPFNTNINNSGVEGFFYSLDNDSQLDDEITTAEDRFGSLIDGLRKGTESLTHNADILSELVAHLEARTRHLRQNFALTAERILEELLCFVGDKNAYGAYLRRRIQKDPDFLREAIVDELRKRDIPEAVIPQVLEAFWPQMKQILPQIFPSVLANLTAMSSALRMELPLLMKDAAKSGHIKARRFQCPSAKSEA